MILKHDNPVIQAHATNLWAQTLALCTPTNRHEVGCWVLLDTATDTYSFTTTTNGPPTPNNQDSYIYLGTPPSDVPLFPTLQHGSAVYAVSAIHTHTPTTFRTDGSRIVGASPGDKTASFNLHIPSLIYDYEETPVGSGVIPIGHPMTANAKMYKTESCPRRPSQ